MRGSVRRSWLLVPCDDAVQVEQATAAAAEVIVLDLMEFVPEGAKPAARERLSETITALARGDAEVFVQVDNELLYADLSAAVWPGLSGILIPHLESPQDITDADGLFATDEELLQQFWETLPFNARVAIEAATCVRGRCRSSRFWILARGITTGWTSSGPAVASGA